MIIHDVMCNVNYHFQIITVLLLSFSTLLAIRYILDPSFKDICTIFFFQISNVSYKVSKNCMLLQLSAESDVAF